MRYRSLSVSAAGAAYVVALLKVAPMNSNVHFLIPRLETPADAEVQNGKRETIFGSAQTSAVLVSNLALPTIVAHYAAQLEQAGWICTKTDVNGFIAWQTWKFLDGTQEIWSGRFFYSRCLTDHKDIISTCR